MPSTAFSALQLSFHLLIMIAYKVGTIITTILQVMWEYGLKRFSDMVKTSEQWVTEVESDQGVSNFRTYSLSMALRHISEWAKVRREFP